MPPVRVRAAPSAPSIETPSCGSRSSTVATTWPGSTSWMSQVACEPAGPWTHSGDSSSNGVIRCTSTSRMPTSQPVPTGSQSTVWSWRTSGRSYSMRYRCSPLTVWLASPIRMLAPVATVPSLRVSEISVTSAWSGASGDDTVIGVVGSSPGTQRKMPCFWFRPKS